MAILFKAHYTCSFHRSLLFFDTAVFLVAELHTARINFSLTF